MNEPATVLTDYALGAVSVFLGIKLPGKSKFWALAFLAVGVAALLGGTWHGFWQSELLWKATTLAAGVASFGMVVGSANVAATGKLRSALIGFASVKLAIYSVWMLSHDEFIWVVVDTGSALAIVGLLHILRWNPWMVAGVAVSVMGALVQASGFALHAHFNHNDLYHVIQTAAMLVFYVGLKEG
jgi:hypothetical protein